MSQIATLPLLSRHNMSVFPSPLKSRLPAIVQLVLTCREGIRQDLGAVHEPDRHVASGVTPQYVAMPLPLKS